MEMNPTFLFLLFLSLFSVSTCRKILSVDTPYGTKTYDHVCDPSRFNDLGLDINNFAYCNTSLSYDVRVKDLIDRMTLNEKVHQLGDKATGVERIGLARYSWWSEALHGVSNFGDGATFFDDVVPGATSFPTPIHTAASFNVSLWKTIGQAVSTEARAMYNLGHSGLTYWSPNINVVRDPRWGRALETPGEDPYVAGIYASNYVRGLQDVEGTENATDLNARPLKVAACCKHYAAYDVDNWLGVDRTRFDARVTEQDMLETFVKPFEMCVKDGDVSSVMCSYNRINGIPACADPRLLKDTIRGEWDLHGYIVSDCDSIQVMVEGHKWLSDEPEDAVAQVLKAGLDLDCGEYYPRYGGKAVTIGKVKESEVDSALKNLYIVLMRLGFFDGISTLENLDKKDVCSEDHINLAIEAAREGVVLLKNDNETLPLDSKKINSIALVGPHANATKVMIGNYAGVPCKYTSPLDAFKKELKEVIFEEGCDGVPCKNESFIYQAVEAAKKADATVIMAGLDLSIEAEGLDRMDLLLPGYQTQLINQVATSSKGPVILVVMSAGGVDISFAKNNPNIKSILWVGYPGEEGGHGIADAILGKYNPGGRLPLTWHESNYVDLLPMTSMPLRPVESLNYPGRTYRFFGGATVYPFGYGLSYTAFNYKLDTSTRSLDIPLSKHQHCRDLNHTDAASKPSCPAVSIEDINSHDTTFDFDVEIQNTGKLDGSEVVMVYWIAPKDITGAPIKQLIAFKKVFLAAGQTTKVNFKVNASKDLGLVDSKGYTVLASGSHTIVLGNGVASFPITINLNNSH